MRLFSPSVRRLARQLALLGGLVFVGSNVVWPWAQEQLSEQIGRVARSGSAPRSDWATHSKWANSPAAYETLLALDDSALGTLLRNAVASDPEVARPARAALAIRVDTWRAQDAAGGSLRLALHVDRMLTEMERQTPSMTYSSKAWATRFADRLLAMTPLVPINKRGTLIASVDHLLETLATTPTLPDPPAPTMTPIATQPVPKEITEPIPTRTPKKPRVAVVESTPPPSVRPPPPRTIAAKTLTEKNSVGQDKEAWQPAWRDGQVSLPGPRPKEPRPKGHGQLEPRPLVAEPAQPLMLPDNYSSATDRQLLAALLKNEAPLRTSQQPRATGPASKPGPASKSVKTDWRLAKRLESLGNALRSRGFTGVSMTHVRLLLSESVSDRIRLVERLLVDRTGDTARLLLLLAQDESADVRVAAITALGSSPRKELVEAAWALALRDKDARVARVAEQIRERRK